jgi:hypothetical protein
MPIIKPRKAGLGICQNTQSGGRELEAAGVDIIQFDEPAFNVFFDEVNDWGIAARARH